MTLGSRIRQFRLKRGYTQSQMASKLKMTEANFSSYERNKSVPPSEKLSQIASILNVSTDYLLGHTNIPSGYLGDEYDNERDYQTSLLWGIVKQISEGPHDNPRFSIPIRKAIESESKDFRLKYSNLFFEYTPNGIMQVANEADNIQTIIELIEVINRAKDTTIVEIPDWATAKDKRDFKKMLEDDAPVMFDGVPIEGEARQRVMDILTGLFWEAKQMNKKTYGRKKKTNPVDEE